MELFFLAILVLLMIVALGSGYPVAFALPGSAILAISLAAISGQLYAGDPSAFFAQGGPVQWLSAGVTNFRGIYWEAERDTLIAIPLFIFMGIMLQRSKIAEDLLVTMAQLFGPIPGGLGISVVFVGALLAATTGIVGATVVAMGLISLPAMLQRNYSKPLATGTIAASGTLGQIIPPSIVLIILADQLSSAVDQAGTSRKEFFKVATGELSMPSEFNIVSTSAGDMFLGALVPGLVLVGLYMAFILIFALIKPSAAPPVPFEGKVDRRFVGTVLMILVPPLALIFLVLGSIIAGIATVNQAGAIGAVGAMMMAGYRLKPGCRDTFAPAILGMISLITIMVVTSIYDINVKNIQTNDDVIGVTLAVIAVFGLTVSILWSGWRAYKIEDTLSGVMIDTAKTTSLVFIILLGAAMLTAAFRSFGGEELVKEFLNGMPGGFWSKFVIVMAVIFFLGFFLDFIEIAVVVVPIVSPILLADPSANVTAVWLGVMIGLNIQTSFLTPPFGFALFYLRGVAPPSVKTLDMYKGVIAFIGLQLVALAVVGNYPALVNYLPNRVSLTSDTAPPPRNPRLQYCMEEYVAAQFAENGDALRKAIKEAQGLDYSYLPKKLQTGIDAGFKKAETTFELIAAAKQAEAAIEAEAVNYRPLHIVVREIQNKALIVDTNIKLVEQQLRRAEADSPLKQIRETRLGKLNAERDALLATTPESWEVAHKAFLKHTKAERSARNAYRKAVDAAYEPVVELRAIIADTGALGALGPVLNALQADVPGLEFDPAIAKIEAVIKQVGDVAGTGDIKGLLTKARRSLKSKTPNPEEAAQFLSDAAVAFDADLAWRKRAEAGLKNGLAEYDAAIHDTIGLRGQPRLPKEQALFVASCSAGHRDISLSF
ncbi:MAG TPA: TRAP transporter large permease subunit [Thermohalobaculum sp.]|nr:TRAP transporter large permease subunit [Thermohalobaculum sp.]